MSSSSSGSLPVVGRDSDPPSADVLVAADSEIPLRLPPSQASLARAVQQASFPKVAGNIHHARYRDFWAKLNPDPYVWSIICHGYKIPFRTGVTPQAYSEPNNRSALDNMPYVQDHVDTLLEDCLLYTSPSPRDRQKSRMPSSA